MSTIPMSARLDAALLPRGALVVVLVLAPLCEVAEAILSPLAGTTTAADLAAIDVAQGTFVASALLGLVATILYLPAFLGLAAVCVGRAPVLARIGAAFSLLSMAGFLCVRGIQAVELAAVRTGQQDVGATIVDATTSNPLGATMVLLFLGGSVVGAITLAAACWRAGLPRPAAVLFLAFPLVDLAWSGSVGTVVSHLVLLVALGWFALALRCRSVAREG